MNRHTNAATDHHFLLADNIRQTTGFQRLSFQDLVELAEMPEPQSEKMNIAAFLPTLANEKTKAAINHVDAQTALIIDIDEGNWSPERLREKLDALDCNFLAYTTFSSRKDLLRWRIVLPLANPLPVKAWLKQQRYVCNEFGGDPCATRVHQPSFLPAQGPETYYMYLSETKRGHLQPQGSGLQELAADQDQYDTERQETRRNESRLPERPDLGSGAGAQFEQLKAKYSLCSLLEEAGFARDGEKFIPPESQSGAAGVHLFDDQQGYCHNTSCPLHNNGRRFDVLDVLLHYRYGGDWGTLLRAENSVPTIIESTLENESNNTLHRMPNALELETRLEQFRLVKFTNEVATQAQYPPFSAMLTGFSVLSAMIGAAYCICYPDGQKLSAGLYVCTEQPPGSAKSRVLAAFTNPILKEARSGKPHSKRVEENVARTSHNMTFFHSNITPEALEEQMLLPNNGHFSLASAEQGLSDVLLGHTRGSDRKNDNDLLLKGFGGEWHSSSRITRQGYQGFVHGSVTLVAQPGTIEKVLDGSHGQGVAERFLFLSEPTLVGKRDFCNPPEPNWFFQKQYDSAVRMLNHQIAELVSSNLENLRTLTICSEGWKAIAHYRQKIEPDLADGRPLSHGVLRGIFGKADMQIMKIAAVLHVSESTMAGSDIPQEIALPCIKAAIQLTDQLLRNTALILTVKGRLGSEAECEAILRIFKHGAPKTERQIIQSRSKVEPFSVMTGDKSQAIRKALNRCLELGWLKLGPGPERAYILS